MVEREMSERILDKIAEINDDQPCVYFIQCGGLTKIGYTKNLTRRLEVLKSLNYPSGSKGLGVVEKVYEIRSKSPDKLEKDIHEILNKEKVIGEWYNLKENDLNVIRELCFDLVENAESEEVLKERKEILIRPTIFNYGECRYGMGSILIPEGNHYIIGRQCQILSNIKDEKPYCHSGFSEENCPVAASN